LPQTIQNSDKRIAPCTQHSLQPHAVFIGCDFACIGGAYRGDDISIERAVLQRIDDAGAQIVLV